MCNFFILNENHNLNCLQYVEERKGAFEKYISCHTRVH